MQVTQTVLHINEGQAETESNYYGQIKIIVYVCGNSHTHKTPKQLKTLPSTFKWFLTSTPKMCFRVRILIFLWKSITFEKKGSLPFKTDIQDMGHRCSPVCLYCPLIEPNKVQRETKLDLKKLDYILLKIIYGST